MHADRAVGRILYRPRTSCVIMMKMGKDDSLRLKRLLFHKLNELFRLVTRIDDVAFPAPAVKNNVSVAL